MSNVPVETYIAGLQRSIGSHALEPGELLAMFPHSWRECTTPGLCATCRAAATLIGKANAERGATVADYRALFPDELHYAQAQRAVAFSRLRYAADNRMARVLTSALEWWRGEVARIELHRARVDHKTAGL